MTNGAGLPPALPYLALPVIFLVLFLYGLRARQRRGRPSDWAFASKLALASFSAAGASVGVVVPAIWLFVSLAIYGGTVENNVPPGYSAQFILGVLLIGPVLVALGIAYGYRELLDS